MDLIHHSLSLRLCKQSLLAQFTTDDIVLKSYRRASRINLLITSIICLSSLKADCILVCFGRGTSYQDEKAAMLTELIPYKKKLYTLVDRKGLPYAHPLSPIAHDFTIEPLKLDWIHRLPECANARSGRTGFRVDLFLKREMAVKSSPTIARNECKSPFGSAKQRCSTE